MDRWRFWCFSTWDQSNEYNDRCRIRNTWRETWSQPSTRHYTSYRVTNSSGRLSASRFEMTGWQKDMETYHAERNAHSKSFSKRNLKTVGELQLFILFWIHALACCFKNFYAICKKACFTKMGKKNVSFQNITYWLMIRQEPQLRKRPASILFWLHLIFLLAFA